MHALTPAGPFQVGDCPVGMSAITIGGVTVRSNTTSEESALPTNIVCPSGVTVIPSGEESGLTPLPREAQQIAPGKPPKFPSPLQPKFSGCPSTSSRNGGMLGSHGLGGCAEEIELSPPIAPTARSSSVSTITTSRPIRSET